MVNNFTARPWIRS